ncbi:MAG: hypothetical protein CML57_08220, partial [Rhodobacteraceae bacterium]|nr:hypothetical protein [Paracoccaceae bacterium]
LCWIYAFEARKHDIISVYAIGDLFSGGGGYGFRKTIKQMFQLIFVWLLTKADIFTLHVCILNSG